MPERERRLSQSRDQGKHFASLSGLHPAGFSHCPVALLEDQRRSPGHIAVYVAIASRARADGPTTWTARGLARAEIHAATGISDKVTLRTKIRDLADWGYIEEQRKPNAASDFILLPTDRQPGQADRTNAPGVSSIAPVQAAPSAHQSRTNAPWGSENPTVRPPDSALTTDGALVHPTPGAPEHPSPAPSLHPSLPSYIEMGRQFEDETCGCDEPHPPFVTHAQFRRLAKAVGRRAATHAVAEVQFRLAFPSVAGEVRKPFALAREIGQCYAGRCRKDAHGDFHGAQALMYHAGRRNDIEQEVRHRGGAEPVPESLGPLGAVVRDLAGDTPGADEDMEERRRQAIAQLRRQEAEEARTSGGDR